jgi:hypothetical protein
MENQEQIAYAQRMVRHKLATDERIERILAPILRPAAGAAFRMYSMSETPDGISVTGILILDGTEMDQTHHITWEQLVVRMGEDLDERRTPPQMARPE